MNVRPRLRSPLSVWRALSFLCFAAAACGAAGCGRVPGQFEILNDQIPPASGECVIPADETKYQGSGLMDVSIVQSSFDTAYLFFPLIENNLSGTQGASDPNQIQLTGFDVDISQIGSSTPAAAQVLSNAEQQGLLRFRVPWSGGVKSNGGHITAVVQAVPVELALQLASNGGLDARPSLTLNLRIQALGTTNSGRSLTSDPFNFPLEVCSGCLVGNVAPCPFTTPLVSPGNACNPAQDDVVDCCTENGKLLCPAPVVTP